jgi:hypothetical protein
MHYTTIDPKKAKIRTHDHALLIKKKTNIKLYLKISGNNAFWVKQWLLSQFNSEWLRQWKLRFIIIINDSNNVNLSNHVTICVNNGKSQVLRFFLIHRVLKLANRVHKHVYCYPHFGTWWPESSYPNLFESKLVIHEDKQTINGQRAKYQNGLSM